MVSSLEDVALSLVSLQSLMLLGLVIRWQIRSINISHRQEYAPSTDMVE
jgi:hypothetical protein